MKAMLATLLSIWVMHIVVVVSPGAAVMLTSHLAATEGRQAASYGALGIALGAGLWAIAAVLGIGGLLLRWPALRVGLQSAGALYLLYVAYQLWNAGPVRKALQPIDRRRAFRSGLLTNLSNPTAALFFASIFSSALPLHPPLALVLAAIAMVSMNSLGWHLTLAYAISRDLAPAPGSNRRVLWSRIAGAVIGGFALLMLANAFNPA
jgi:threonine/homoserine/homoserine lactone efflux protein